VNLEELLAALADETADHAAQLAEVDADVLAALADEIVTHFNELSQGELSSDTIEAMERLADARDIVRTEGQRRDEAAAAAIERVTQLAQRINGDGTAGDGDEADDAEGGDTDGGATGDSSSDDDESEQAPAEGAEGEPVTPTAERELVPARARNGVNLAAVKARAGTPRLPSRNTGRASILAAANLPGIAQGAKLNQSRLTDAALAAMKGFPSKKLPNTRMSANIATIQKPFPKDLMKSDDASDEQNEILMARAVDQSRLPGGSLLASGGWCAPSETVYDLCEPETEDGMVSVAELGIKRGGLRYPVSPLFSDIYSGVGFQQTEVENIAAEEKDCYEVTCPSFTEVRLDAKGVCITAGILQQRGYPEMVQRVIRGAMTAHAHKMNAYTLARLEALSTAVTATLAGFGAWTDTLAAAELQVEDVRYKYRLGENQVMEGIFPRWIRPILRADLTARNGSDPNNPATNAQLDAHFRARGVNPQWVVDWQDAYVNGGTGIGKAVPNVAWPTTAKFLLYPAGTFVKGTADIISLDAIYDSTNIKTNNYTALFTEEGVLVAKRCMEGRVVTLPEICAAGRSGAQVAYDCTP
jgi:hypothetical protein